MKEIFESKKSKKTYQAPKVVAISLRPEEAVLGSCKASGASGPIGSACMSLGPCNTPGS